MTSLLPLICLILAVSGVLSQEMYPNRRLDPMRQSYQSGPQSPQHYVSNGLENEDNWKDREDSPLNEWEPSTTVLTPYELYQTNWCRGLLRPSAPIDMPDASELMDFEEKHVIPQYRSLWHRSCYMPQHSVGVASVLLNRGLGIANSGLRQAIGGANTAITSGRSALRDILSRVQQN